MLPENESNKVWVHLYGGEQDGFRRRIELKTKPPRKFYIWHVNDAAKIEEMKGKERMVLQNRLAVMAYELYDDVELPGTTEPERELRYRRLESADKVTADPAV